MLLIIAFHYVYHGDVEFDGEMSAGHYFLLFTMSGGKIGVAIFVLITGYFMSASGHFKISKLIKLWLQVFSYSMVLYLICLPTYVDISWCGSTIDNLMPISHSRWWFASTFFILYLLTPFINILINNMTQKQYQVLLLLIFAIWCVIPTFTTKKMNGNNLTYFVFIYCLAGYIRRYDIAKKISKGALITLFSASYLLTFGLLVAVKTISPKKAFMLSYELNSLTVLICAVSLFLLFAGMNIKSSRIINAISATSFGVYLLHDHKAFRHIIWDQLSDAKHISDNMLIPYTILVIAIVYIGSALIEFIRLNTLEKLYMPVISQLTAKIDSKSGSLFCRNKSR